MTAERQPLNAPLRATLLAILALAALPAAALRAEEKPAKEATVQLSGTWRVVSSTRLGESEEVDEATIIIRGSKLTIREADEEKITLTIKVDASAKPATIDLLAVDEDGQTIVAQGIYERDGERLRLCLADGVARDDVDAIIHNMTGPVLSSRPKKFDDKQGTLIQCQRVREEKIAPNHAKGE